MNMGERHNSGSPDAVVTWSQPLRILETRKYGWILLTYA